MCVCVQYVYIHFSLATGVLCFVKNICTQSEKCPHSHSFHILNCWEKDVDPCGCSCRRCGEGLAEGEPGRPQDEGQSGSLQLGQKERTEVWFYPTVLNVLKITLCSPFLLFWNLLVINDFCMISLKHFGAGLHITTHCGTDWIVCMCWEFSAQRADAKQLERFLHDHSKLSLPLSSTCSQLFLSLSLLLKSKLKCVNNCFWVNVRLVFWSVCVCVLVW